MPATNCNHPCNLPRGPLGRSTLCLGDLGARGTPRGSATYPDLRWVRAPPAPRTLSDFGHPKNQSGNPRGMKRLACTDNRFHAQPS
jgi:hypothetical protein